MTAPAAAAKLAKGLSYDRTSAYIHYDIQFQGERYRGSTGTRDPEKAAEDLAKLRARLYDEKRLGHAPEAAAAPRLDRALADYCTAELAKHHDNVCDQTKSAQRSQARCLIAAFGAATPIDAALAKFDDWRNKAIASGKAKRTVNNYLIMLKAAAAHAGFAKEAEAVEKEGKLKDRVRYLEPEETRRLFDALVAEPVLRDFIVFLLDTGARRYEALSVEWPHVLLDRRVKGRPVPAVILHASKDREGTRRTIPLSERAAAIMHRMRSRRLPGARHVWPWDADTLAIRTGAEDSNRGRITPLDERPPGVSKAAPWLAYIKVAGRKIHLGTFPTEDDAIAARRAAEREHFATVAPTAPGLVNAWEDVRTAAKLDDFHMHDTRHDFASRLVRGGMHLKKVATLLGHKTTAMVDKVYGHLAPSDLDEAAGVLDSAAATSDALDLDAAGDDEPIVVDLAT